MTIDWPNFTPFSALVGGALIGLSATAMLLLHGRVAGITGIGSAAFDPETGPRERLWRWVFLAGLLAGAAVFLPLFPDRFVLGIQRSHFVLALAGMLVGLGTRVGSGCTSGHGVCGISRGSMRSLAATLVFIATGVITVYLYSSLTGGL